MSSVSLHIFLYIQLGIYIVKCCFIVSFILHFSIFLLRKKNVDDSYEQTFFVTNYHHSRARDIMESPIPHCMRVSLTFTPPPLPPVGGNSSRLGVLFGPSELPLDDIRPSGVRTDSRSGLLPRSHLRELPGKQQQQQQQTLPHGAGMVVL